MRRKKNFVVVAYDISDDRRRSAVVKILEGVGVRVNCSVFECLLTDAGYEQVKAAILSKIDLKVDRVIYYPVCVDCYAKIVYQPPLEGKYEKVVVIG